MNESKKRLNLVLTNGLCVIHAKVRPGASIITLFVTDYTNNTRILFDLENKRVLTNRDNIELTAKDIENLTAALQQDKDKAVV